MRVTTRAVCWSVAGLIVGAFVIRGAAQSQTTEGRAPETTAQLVEEVHGLRVARERLASTGLRIQLALGRVQLEEQRIETLQRRLDTVHESIRTDNVGAHPELKTEASQIEQDIAAEAAHWSAFNEQLQTLEKTIDVPR
jgi:hypothetical protein